MEFWVATIATSNLITPAVLVFCGQCAAHWYIEINVVPGSNLVRARHQNLHKYRRWISKFPPSIPFPEMMTLIFAVSLMTQLSPRGLFSLGGEVDREIESGTLALSFWFTLALSSYGSSDIPLPSHTLNRPYWISSLSWWPELLLYSACSEKCMLLLCKDTYWTVYSAVTVSATSVIIFLEICCPMIEVL